MKYFVVSDVHDHYDALMEALNINRFELNNAEHILILCGDAFYSGPQPGKMFTLLRSLNEAGRLIFIYGNHDLELLDNLKAGAFRRPANRKCAELLVSQISHKECTTDDELISECAKIGFTDFLERVPVWFYETDHYIFTHGFIPTDRNEYKPDWRSSTEREWRKAAFRGDALLLSMRYGIHEPNKIIVCGHYSAARCYRMKDATIEDWENRSYKDVSSVPPEGFRTFISDSMIALDGSVKKTGFINCVVLEAL